MTSVPAAMWHGSPMRSLIALLTLLWSFPAGADAPVIAAADAQLDGGRWTVTVTLKHRDSGWDHFATGLAVLAPDGSRIGSLDLTRPNVGKSRFTARITGLKVPPGTEFVLIRSRCSLVGWAAEPVRVDLPQ